MSDLPKAAGALSPERLALIEKLLKQKGVQVPKAEATIPRRPESGPCLLSFAQQRLWFLSQLESDNWSYNVPASLRLAGPLDVAAFQQSLDTIVERHEILRTTFATADGQPVQVIAPAQVVPLPLLDLQTLSPDEREAEARRMVADELRRPFDLARGPLIRASLLRLSAEDHVLLLTLHHIVADGWSIGVFIRELIALYGAFAQGTNPTLPELPIQYADYAVWQRDWLKGTELENQLAYWKQQLADLTVLELPTDYQRPPVPSFRGAVQTFELSPALSEGLASISRRQDATLFMTLLTAFQVLLARYSGQHDIVVGSPIAGRMRAEVADLMGCFVNTLVLRTDLGDNPTFAELLGRVRQGALDAYAHQDLPFEQVVEALQPERDLSRNPLFQVMFDLQNAPPSAPELPGLAMVPLTLEHSTEKFDLSLSFEEAEGKLSGVLRYSTDLFAPATIAQMLEHFQTLLHGIVADPGRPIADLPLLTEAEQQQLRAWNPSATTVPSNTCVHDLFAAQAARTPEAVAVVFGDRALTYEELDRRANQLAHELRRLGVGPEVRVGLYLQRSLDLVVALLGIWKAGGAYVPLDPNYPAQRLAFLLADAEIAVVITQQDLVATVPSEIQAICLDRDWDRIAQADVSAPDTGVQPEHLAYVIYTSGSTGQPKGVLVNHSNLLATLWASQTEFQFQSGDVMPWIASVTFDIALFELFNPLLAGGTALVLSQEQVLDLPRLCTTLAACTVVHSVPSLMRQIVQQIRVEGRDVHAYDQLRMIFVGGELVPPELLSEMQATFPQAQIVVLYGPTEATIICTAYRVQAGLSGGRALIGSPLPNAQVRLYDCQGQLVPRGVVGEIYIGGAGVTRGYLHRPELSAEKFVELDGQRWYKSGDLGRCRADGVIEFLGRGDEQVKVRGYRIELGEVAAVLGKHPAVRESVVMAQAAPEGDQRLVAYVVPDAEIAPTVRELRSFVGTYLPEYMVPAAFVLLPALPLTAHGKLDRKALPAPEGDELARDGLYVAPRTPIEEVLAGIWASVLHLERVSVQESFFALGGHSLLATQVVARAREAFQVELPLRSLFEMATVAELAERIISMQRAEWQIPSLVPVARESTLPLSYAQQRLWFIDRLQPNSAAYNIPAAWRVAGPLDVAALAHSLNTIVARHEVLRTTFAATSDSQPVQVVAAPQPYMFPIIDLQSLPAADRETAARQIIDTETQRPFDLAGGPLMRMALLRLAAEEHVLLLTMHHIIADGWSMGVLINELATLYAARIHEEPAALPALPIQYADYAVWQRDWLRDEVLETHLAYWKRQLSDLVVLELPTDYPRPAALSDRGAGYIFVLPQALSDELATLSRREGVTLFMTLLAAWQILLARYSGQRDIAVGSPIANRTQSETEHLIGFFVNTLVLRTDLTGNPSFRDVLARVREVCLGAYAHQDLPFEQLVDVVRPTRDLSHNPLFQVMFTLGQASAGAGSELPGLNLQPLSIERQTAQFDLTLTMDETPTGLVGMLEYSVDLFAAPTIERMASHFQTLLAGIIAQPEQSYADLPLLSAPQRRELLVDWNTTATAYSHELCLHHLFEATAERTPDAIAVVYESQQLTYGELNNRANRLAHDLRERGVGPEVRVGLCVERSLEMVVGLLGILKAGGAYLPLDPTYPTERLAFVLADAQVPLVLTQEHLRAQLPSTAAVVCLEADLATSVDASASAPHSAVRSTNAAYVIYTSGSTGQPKGVLVEHQALVNYTLSMLPHFDLQPGDRMLQFASPSFDVVVEEIFPTWAAGAAVVLHGAGILASIDDFTSLLDQAQVTAVELPVAYWHAWVDEMAQSGQHVPASLRLVLLGCEKPSLDRLATWQRFDVRSIYVFGLTETAITSTLYHVPDDPTEGGKWSELPIGRPVANTQIYALDARLQPVPIGVPGELYIGGDGLARNYLNQPGQTADRFVPDPFSDVPGSRLYRTGDLVRYRPDGNIEFLGRRDAQVKVRGFRVELGEVEAALGQHPTVRDAVVVLRADGPGGQRLVAYVVGAPMETPTISDLRSFLLDRLPEYMVPSAFVLLDVLPLTTHGKVDRAALPAPDTARPELAETFAAPQTATETLLAAIWASVLRREQVGIHDNFFALGGDSILSIQIIARANQAGVRLTPRQLFQHQTIASLAAVAGTAPAQTAEQGLVEGPVPLTPIQHWFFAQDLPERHHWNQSALFEVWPPLDAGLLEQAVQHVLAHHDALRLRVARTADGWQQRNAGLDATPLVEVIDLSAVPRAEQAAAITEAATQLQTSLDLGSGPLLRVGSFTLGAGQPGRLLIVVHHLAVDTVSWQILLEDLQTAYDQLHRGAQVGLPPKTTSFQQWAERLHAYAQSATLRAELASWLAPARTTIAPLPLDYPGGSNTVESARDLMVVLSAEETDILLRELPPVYRTQINDVLLTALAQACASWTGAATLLVDLEGHGREELFADVDLTRTVGWFTTLYPVLLDLRQAEEPGAALKAVKEQLRQIPNRGIGYGVLRYLSTDESAAELRALPQAEISFNYLGQNDQSVATDGLFRPAREPRGPNESSRGSRSHVLEINGLVVHGELHVHWTYSAALHEESSIAALAQRYLAALRQLIAHCQAPTAGGFTPSDFPLARLDQARLDQLLGTDRLVDDLYPLSPMQQGMLFHTLYETDAGMYITQFVCTIPQVEVGAFQQAWQHVVDRHPILRTAFVWEGLPTPLQIVRRQVAVPWTIEDWRDLDAATQAARLDAVVAADRRGGFDLAQAPLLRLALFRVTDTAYHFLWSEHSLLLDGWSGPLVLNEVLSAYAALVTGQALPSATPRPFRDYIAWLDTQDPRQAEAFWRHTLAGVTAPTALSVDQLAGTTTQASGYAEQVIALPEASSAALQALTRQHGLTLNTVVQGAWALLLSRYSGEADVVFGATVAGRPADLPGVETMVGLFINTLPVRVRVPQDALLLPWLQQLQGQQAELRQYEHSPLVQIQGWSEIPRGQPLFESLVVFENFPVALNESAPDERAILDLQQVRAIEQVNYPLTLASSPGHPLRLHLSYDRRRFDDATIERMLGHLTTLLAAMAAESTQRLGALPLLASDERTRLLREWPVTPAPAPPSACFHELVAAQAARTSDAVALVFAGQQLTYGELDQRVTQLAYALRQHGVGPEVPVALLMEHSLDQIVALLAVLKAGGAYLPLDPAMPAARLQFVLADAEVPLLLTEQALLPTLPPHTAEVLCLDRDWSTIAQAPAVPLPTVGPDTLAYVIYTSGSTGQPKGVLVPQRGIANLAQAQIAAFGVTAASRVLQFAALSFDAALSEVAMALVAGATLVLAARDDLLPGAELLALLQDQAITHVTLPPSVLAALPEAALPALHTIITAGEACPAAVVARWGSGRRLINAYGPTEATVCATLGLTTADGHDPAIGRPIANGRVYVLDAQLEPVPVGVAGELYLGGIGVVRGYLHRPELTADTFIPDPFSDTPGARLYRTGDRGRWRADGQLDFLGRSDQQVKLRGYRIELGEIESALRQQEIVRDAVVLLRHDTPGDPRLVAYVVENGEPRTKNQGVDADGSRFSVLGSTGGEGLPASLRQYLKDRLPAYMVPSAFVVLDALPLTAHGKVDRKALPAPDADGLTNDSLYVAPRTPIEEVLVGVWADVLHLERIGVNDSFFELGGHSLLVTQVISRLRVTFQVELPLRSLFEAPTVAGLARQIEVARQSMQGIQSPPQPASRDSVLPLSFAQQRLWFLDQLQPNSPAYNIPTAIRLIGRLDVAALKRSLDTIVERHEALRTTFTTLNDGQPVQVITPAQALPLPLTDLEAFSEDERELMARRLATEEVQRPFDLAQGPLLRASLLYLGVKEHVLLLTMHHIVSDGWSMGVFVRELVTLYVALSEGTTPALPELPIQYADYAVWQRRWLSGAVLEAQLAYWKQQLADPPVLDLPTDYLRPAVPSFRGAVHTFLLPAALSADLAALSRREGVTLFMTLLAAWQILLARYSGQDDIVVGSPIANRTRAETEDLIGCFINTLVLRTDLGDNPPFQEVLTRVREVALAAFDHQDLPFEQVVDAVQPERDLSRHPLFQVLFALQNAPTAPFELPNLALVPFMVEQGTVNFDLSLSLTESEAGLAGTLEYAVDLFAAETIERMVGHFQTLLAGIVRDPSQRLAQLPLLSETERRQLAVDWNTTQATYSRDRCVHELVAAQAARTPDAVALVYASQQLTYGELDRRANQLAHYLRERGVGPEVRVGLCLERSLELVIGLLGILKAGGAYVPLDPNYPAQRLSFMLEDSQVSVVLTHEQLVATLPADRAKMVYLDTAWSSIMQLPVTPPESSVTANHLAYVIYTSGSTGTPKGVQVEHGNLLATLYASQQHFGFHSGDTMPWLASVAFDIALFELFNPLLAGGTVIMLDHQQILDLPFLLGTLAECTVFHAVPSLMRQITQAISASEDGPSNYDHIRMVFTGGDVVPPELLSELQTVFRQAEIRVLYGPTEATIICTSYRVPERSSVTQHLIGTPLANAQIRIHDTWGSLAPIGVAGELYIGGAGVTRGYLHRPELSAEKFVELDGQRWYRSGDLARYRPDGNLEFLGRRDAQVKVRGFRVELGEVEAALGQHPTVRDAVVILREDGPSGQQLVAYVVGEQPNKRTNEQSTANLPSPAAAGEGPGVRATDEGLSPSELRSFLLNRLPDYMVPSAFVFLEKLPLTAHGKVDRKALPAPDTARPELAETFAAPQTATETLLAAIWASVLRREQVGIHDNFFALGGDSILSIQIIARANQAGVRLTPRQLFQHQTIASLAAVAGTASAQTAEQGLVEGPVPLTPIQHYFFDQELPARHHYNQAMLFEVRSPLDAGLLEQAVQHVLAHHDALRLRFESTADGWQQRNAGLDATPLVEVIDLSAVPCTEQAAAITEAATQLQTSLDLGSGPLVRVGSFTLGPDQPGRVLIVVHHLAVDTVSWQILLEDLQTAYAQLERGAQVGLPPKTTAFQQWAERLHAYAQSATLRAELASWLAPARTTIAPLPLDYPGGVNTLESARSVAVALGEDDTRALLYDVPAVYQTQINDVLLTALAQACASWTGAATLLVDLEGHGREELFADVDLTRTVGWFTALYPVLLDLRGVAAPGAALKAVKEQLRQIPNRGVGYGVLRYLSTDEAAEKLRVLPQAEISFNYWGQGDQSIPTDGLFSPARESSGPSQSQGGLRKHLLEITSIISQGRLHMEWTYSAAIHSQAAIEWLAQGYLGALRTLIDHCRAPEAGGYTPSDFPLAHLDQKAVSKLSALLDEIEEDEEFPE